MDHLSFVFSLLLIVSVTTTICGSVIKAKSPNGEEIEALSSDAGLDHYPEMVPNRQELEVLLKRSHDAQAKLKGQKSSRDKDSEMSKRISPGAAFAGVKLTGGLLKESLDARGSEPRNVTIIIENKSTYTWKDPSTCFITGNVEGRLPDKVENGQNVRYVPHNRPDSATTMGMLSYYIPSINKTLVVLWYVPHKNNRDKNEWNIGLFSGNRIASLEMILNLPETFFKADGEKIRCLDSALLASGLMTPSGEATLRIRVFKESA